MGETVTDWLDCNQAGFMVGSIVAIWDLMTSKQYHDSLLLPLTPARSAFIHTGLTDQMMPNCKYTHFHSTAVFFFWDPPEEVLYIFLCLLMFPLYLLPNPHYIVSTILSVGLFDFRHFYCIFLFALAFCLSSISCSFCIFLLLSLSLPLASSGKYIRTVQQWHKDRLLHGRPCLCFFN